MEFGLAFRPSNWHNSGLHVDDQERIPQARPVAAERSSISGGIALKKIALALVLGISGLLTGCQNVQHPGTTVVTSTPPSSGGGTGASNANLAPGCDTPPIWGSGMPGGTAYGLGGFVATGSMVSARAAHTATLLNDGTVLVVAGGQLDIDDLLVSIPSAEIFNPSTKQFAPAGRPCIARELHTATLLGNGKVLIAGGNEFTGYPTYLYATSTAELYDPATGKFSNTALMTVPRTLHTATMLKDGRVFIAGGALNSGFPRDALGTSEIYDPSAGTFSSGPNLATPRVGHTATILQSGKVLITGGENSQGALSSAEIYDPVTNSFTATGSMTTPRTVHSATPLTNGQVLITGGSSVGTVAPGGLLTNAATHLTSAEIYDPATGKFSPVSNMNLARVAHTSTLLPDGRVLITGGFGDYLNQTMPNSQIVIGYESLNGAETYDPASGTFTIVGPMTTRRFWHQATSLSDGFVLITGGIGDDSPKSSAEIYKP